MQRTDDYYVIPLEEEISLDEPAQQSGITPSNTPADEKESDLSAESSEESDKLSTDSSEEEKEKPPTLAPVSDRRYNPAEALKGIEMGLVERSFFNGVLSYIYISNETIYACHEMLKKYHEEYLVLNTIYADSAFGFFKRNRVKRLDKMHEAYSKIQEILAVPYYLLLTELTQLLKDAIKGKKRLIYEALAEAGEYRQNINKLHEAGFLERIIIDRNEYTTLLQHKAALKEELLDLEDMEETLTAQSLADIFFQVQTYIINQLRALGVNLTDAFPDISRLNKVLNSYRDELRMMRETIQSMCSQLFTDQTIEVSHKAILGIVEKTRMTPNFPAPYTPNQSELKSIRKRDVTPGELAKIRAKHMPKIPTPKAESQQAEESPTLKRK